MVVASGLAVASAALAQPNDEASSASPVESLRCAHRQLGRALQAHGGEARIAALQQLAFQAEGPLRNAYQGFEASRWRDPPPAGALRQSLVLDFAAGRHRQELTQTLPGGLTLSTVTLAQGPQLTTLRPHERLALQDRLPSTEAAVGQVVDLPARLLPPLLLRRARENLSSLRCTAADAFEFNWDTRIRIRMVLDGEGLVREALVPQPDLLDGETTVAWQYHGRRDVAGIAWPDRTRVVRRGVVLSDMSLSAIAVNAGSDAAAFVVPAGFSERVDTTGLSTVRVADGVWEVRGIASGSYRVPVFEADDHLVVFDAPLSGAVTRQVQAQIRQHLDTAKPVRYLVLSHFHGDHSGGAAAWAESGATLVVNPGDVPFVQQMLAARSVFAPPVLPGSTRAQPKLLLVQEELVLPASGPSERPPMHVRRVSGSPHAAQMLVLQSGSVLAQADLHSDLTPFNATSAHFAAWLAQHAAQVRLVLGTHHEPLRAEALQAMAAAAR